MFYNREEYEKMARVESEHWWYKTLHNLVYETIKLYFTNKDVFILDAGCGTGGLIEFLINKGYKNIQGFDLSEFAVANCKRRGLNVSVGDIRYTDLIMPNNYDVVVSNDTLYFFANSEDQKKVIANFYKVLKKGGIAILNLPAFKVFEGIHDVAVSGQYRFTEKDVKKIVDKNLFCIQSVLYWPFLISPIILILRTIQRLKLKLCKNIKIKSDIDLPPKWLNYFLYYLIQFENHVFKNKYFASSLFLVVKKI